MAYIVEQYLGDKGVQLGCEDLVRKMSFGTNWTKLRIGCRYATNGYAAIPYLVPPSSGTPYIPSNTYALAFPVIGICTGSEARLSNNATSALYVNYMGAQYSTSTAYAGTNPLNYYYANTTNIGRALIQRVGQNMETAAYDSSLVQYWSANPSALQSYYYIDLTKKSSTAIISGWECNSSSNVTTTCSHGDFLALMENEANTSHYFSYNTSLALRTAMDWDSAFIGWSRSVPTTCFYDFTVVRFC